MLDPSRAVEDNVVVQLMQEGADNSRELEDVVASRAHTTATMRGVGVVVLEVDDALAGRIMTSLNATVMRM